MKLRTQIVANLAGLALALCLFSVSVMAADQCGDAQGLEEFVQTSKLQQKCPPGSPTCSAQIEKISNSVIRYNNLVKSACSNINQKLNTTKVESQSEALGTLKEKMTYTKDQSDGMVAENEKVKKEVMAAMKPGVQAAESQAKSSNVSASDKSVVSSVSGALKSKNLESSEFDRKKADSVATREVKAELFAPAVGTEVIRALDADKKHRMDLSGKAQTQADNADTAKGKLDSTPSDGEKPAADAKKSRGMMDGLMNPSTLLGIAGAGASLLAAMKKNSSVSSATPDAPPPPAPIAPLAATTLSAAKDGSTAASQKVQMSNDATKAVPVAAATFGGEGYHPLESDVSSKSHSPSLKGGAEAATSAAPGGLGALGGSSEGNSHRDPGSTGLMAKPGEDPAAGSFGGSGGGGGGLSFGNSSSSTAAETTPPAAEDPLRNTLHDAIAAGDTPSDAAAQASDASLEGDNNEILFTRIKSCIQRSVKRGLVISGLTAKIR
jgi:hypothetical protein